MQISRPKYRKAMATFRAMHRQHVPTINLTLRCQGLDTKEIEIFWQSTMELRFFKQADEDFLRRITEADSLEMLL